MSENRATEIRLGVIGVGTIGRAHVRRITAGGRAARLVAVADAAPGAAGAVATEYGVEACSTVGDLLARSDIDAVVIAVPSGLHAPVAVEALDAGKHVLLEKPIDVTVAAADRIIEAERRAGTVLSIASQRRFAAHNQFVHRAIRGGAFGRIVAATVELPLWRTQEYYDERDWRGTWALDGGGALMNQGVHLVDLVLWLLGDVEDVTAYTDTLAHDRIEVEDTVSLSARMTSRAQLSLHATTGSYPGLPIRFTILGDAGSVVVENEEIVRLETRSGLTVPELAEVDQPMAQLDDFLRTVRTGDRPLVTSEQARKAVAFIEAVYESGRTGMRVRPHAGAVVGG